MPIDIGRPPDIHDAAESIIAALEGFFRETYPQLSEANSDTFESKIQRELRVSGHSWGIDPAKLEAAWGIYEADPSPPEECLALVQLAFAHAVRSQHFHAEGCEAHAADELATASYFHGVLEGVPWESRSLARKRILNDLSEIEAQLQWTFATWLESGETTGDFEDVIVGHVVDPATQRVDCDAVDAARDMLSSLGGENFSNPDLPDLAVSAMRAAWGYASVAKHFASTWDVYMAYDAALAAQEVTRMLEGREWGMHARIHIEPRERVQRMNDGKHGPVRMRAAIAMKWYDANRHALDESGRPRFSSDDDIANEIARTAAVGVYIPESAATVRKWITAHRRKRRG